MELRGGRSAVMRTAVALGCFWIAATAFRSVDPASAAEAPARGEVRTDSATPLRIEPGAPVSGDLAGGEVRSYHFRLESGQYLRVVVEATDFALSLSLSGPDGRELGQTTTGGTLQPSEICLISSTPGEYRLELRSPAKESPAGHYKIRIDEPRVATAEDRRRVEAVAAVEDADRLHREGSEESLRKAVDRYLGAVALWQAAHDRSGEAKTLGSVGELLNDLGESRRALQYHQRVLEAERALKDRAGEALALNNVGYTHHLLGELAEGLEAHTAALALARKIANREEEALSLSHLGAIYSDVGDPRKAIDSLTESVALYRSLDDPSALAGTLNSLASIYDDMGQLQRALEGYREVLTLVEAAGERHGQAVTLGNIGTVYRDLGEPQKALELFEKSLALRRIIGDRRGQATSLTHIGWILDSTGQARNALEVYEQALSLQRAVEDRDGEAFTLAKLGQAYRQLGDSKKALDSYGRALELARAVADPRWESEVLIYSASLLTSLGRSREASEELVQALEIKHAVADRRGEPAALFELARADLAAGDRKSAQANASEALRVIESVRTTVANAELRATFLSTFRGSFELLIDLLMTGPDHPPDDRSQALALETAERVRARSLLETLTEAGADIREGVDTGLLDRQRSFQQQLARKAEDQTKMLSGKHTEEQAAQAGREVEALAAQVDQVQAKIRAASPRYAALTQPRPLTAPEIQGLLGKDTLLLEYFLGEKRSFVWAVGNDSLSSFPLPPRSEIEAAAKKTYKESSRPAAGRPRGAGGAALLSDLILRPVAHVLGRKRLVIVADGALYLVPFAALPEPGKTAPLAADHELVSLPSASVLEVLRREAADRRPAPKVVAVFADPVFDRDDRRVRSDAPAGVDRPGREAAHAPAAEDTIETALTRSARDLGAASTGPLFPRLPFSRQEATAILELVPPSRRKAALDFDASRTTAMGADLSQYRFLHFATHGILDAVHPDLSGLVLSLVNREGRDQDGFLPAMEIFNLRLSADMVVLSACRTALGREIRGEGLVGLTRAFMYAGTSRVVASLWRVDDAATAELMKRFYQGMLGPRKLRPAAALRQAQLAVAKQKRWRDPFYWAGFVLQGEWN